MASIYFSRLSEEGAGEALVESVLYTFEFAIRCDLSP